MLWLQLFWITAVIICMYLILIITRVLGKLTISCCKKGDIDNMARWSLDGGGELKPSTLFKKKELKNGPRLHPRTKDKNGQIVTFMTY